MHSKILKVTFHLIQFHSFMIAQSIPAELTKVVPRDALLDLTWAFERLPHLKVIPSTHSHNKKKARTHHPKTHRKTRRSRSHHVSRSQRIRSNALPQINIIHPQIECIKPYLISNLYTLSIQLEQVTVHDVLNSISELLDIEGPGPWRHLIALDCSKNYIPILDKSMVTIFFFLNVVKKKLGTFVFSARIEFV